MIDSAVLAELDGALGASFVAECLAVYLADAGRLRAELEQALTADDLALITRTAHALGSSSATVGARALSELCRRVEYGGPATEPGTQLADLFGATVEAMTAEIDRRSPLA